MPWAVHRLDVTNWKVLKITTNQLYFLSAITDQGKLTMTSIIILFVMGFMSCI